MNDQDLTLFLSADMIKYCHVPSNDYFENTLDLINCGSSPQTVLQTVKFKDLISCLHLDQSRCDAARHSGQAWANIIGKNFSEVRLDSSEANNYVDGRVTSGRPIRASHMHRAETLIREEEVNYEPTDTALTVEMIPELDSDWVGIYIHRGYPGERFPLLYRSVNEVVGHDLDFPLAFTFESLKGLNSSDCFDSIRTVQNVMPRLQREYGFLLPLDSYIEGLAIALKSNRSRTIATSLGILPAHNCSKDYSTTFLN